MLAGLASPAYQGDARWMPDLEGRKARNREGGKTWGFPAEGGGESLPCLSLQQMQTMCKFAKRKIHRSWRGSVQGMSFSPWAEVLGSWWGDCIGIQKTAALPGTSINLQCDLRASHFTCLATSAAPCPALSPPVCLDHKFLRKGGPLSVCLLSAYTKGPTLWGLEVPLSAK